MTAAREPWPRAHHLRVFQVPARHPAVAHARERAEDGAVCHKTRHQTGWSCRRGTGYRLAEFSAGVIRCPHNT